MSRTPLNQALSPVPEIDPKVAEVAAAVRAMIADNRVDPLSAIGILRAAAAVGASWDVVEDVVREIAKGADGISGTADDLIPASTINMLSALLHSGVVKDIVAWAVEVGAPALATARRCCPLRPLWAWLTGLCRRQ